jgi:putative PEP-CTERM system histidine kinase
MPDVDLSTLFVLSHAAGAVAYAAFGGLLAFGRGEGGSRRALIIAVAAQVAWGTAAALTAGYGERAVYAEYALPARTLAITGAVIALVWMEGARQQARALASLLVVVGATWAAIYADFLLSSVTNRWLFFVQIATPMLGLIAVENWFRNTVPDQRWAVKFAVVGFGLIFGYDLVTYIAASITGTIDPYLVAARGIVGAIAVPLMMIATARRRDWTTGLHVSRQAAFYSASVVVCGGIFVLAAAGGQYVRNAGGSIGTFIQIVGTAAIAVGVVVLLGSGAVRSRLKRVIEQNFFSYKYDYRVEWTRFITTIGAQDAYASLPARVVRAIADVLDSPGGVLWLVSADGRAYTAAATWHVYGRLSPLPATTPLAASLLQVRGVTVLDGELTARCSVEEQQALAGFWAAIPLRHAAISGFVTLLPPRALRNLSWEDTELLHIVAEQAASYLAEEAASRRLLEAQQLEEFSQRFTFVAHDLKNLISQLQLLLRNSERHRNNPDFQRDLLATLANSVDKMKRLLEQLRPQSRAIVGDTASCVDLVEVATEVERRWAVAGVRFNRVDSPLTLSVRADSGRLHAAVDHIVQNAIDAAGTGGHVTVSLLGRSDDGCLVIADDGPGMDERFVRDELFRPFRSTKASGYGVGAYQARELVRSMGGSLEVRSAPGEGTAVTISVPSTARSAALSGLER